MRRRHLLVGMSAAVIVPLGFAAPAAARDFDPTAFRAAQEAVTLAARTDTVAHAGAVMLTFGVGAVIPVLAFAYGSRRTLVARGRELRMVATIGKPAMGVALLAVGALTVTGTDKVVETWILDRMPEWLLVLSTRL